MEALEFLRNGDGLLSLKLICEGARYESDIRRATGSGESTHLLEGLEGSGLIRRSGDTAPYSANAREPQYTATERGKYLVQIVRDYAELNSV